MHMLRLRLLVDYRTEPIVEKTFPDPCAYQQPAPQAC